MAMPKTEKLVVSLPDAQVRAVEKAVAEGRASSVHAYVSAAITAYAAGPAQSTSTSEKK